MADYEVRVGGELLPGLLSGQDGLAKLVEAVLNQILEAQVAESLGADKHELYDERQGYWNGHRSPRGLDRALLLKLAEGQGDGHDNLAITGPTGAGKSWLASVLGHKACRGPGHGFLRQ